ncbi:MAG: hypothetical protein HBSAPP02_22430 [Phycisphaerae bacterium]|nr:MAG: hypothetical protein HBSAPP02_22430 [Phycisphaerae bacterium]
MQDFPVRGQKPRQLTGCHPQLPGCFAHLAAGFCYEIEHIGYNKGILIVSRVDFDSPGRSQERFDMIRRVIGRYFTTQSERQCES